MLWRGQLRPRYFSAKRAAKYFFINKINVVYLHPVNPIIINNKIQNHDKG